MQEFVIDEIEKYLDEDKKNLPYATKENIGCTVDYAAGRNRYLGYLMSLALCSFRNMRVGLDCANGSAWMIAKNVFEHLVQKHMWSITSQMELILIQIAVLLIFRDCRLW